MDGERLQKLGGRGSGRWEGGVRHWEGAVQQAGWALVAVVGYKGFEDGDCPPHQGNALVHSHLCLVIPLLRTCSKGSNSESGGGGTLWAQGIPKGVIYRSSGGKGQWGEAEKRGKEPDISTIGGGDSFNHRLHMGPHRAGDL